MIKSKIKRAITGLLAGLMLVSSPLTSLAEGVNGTGSGEVSTPSTPEIVGSFWKIHANQGWRITVVNAHGVAVSTSLDVVKYFPEKVQDIFGKSGEDTQMLWNNYKNNSGSNRGVPKTKIRYLGGAKTDLWFSYSLVDIGGTPGSNGVYSTYKTDGDYSSQNNDNTGLTPAKMINYEILQMSLQYAAQSSGATLLVNGQNSTAEYTAANGEKRTISTKFLSPLEEGVTSSGAAKLTGTGEMFKNQLMSPVNYTDGNVITLVEFMLNTNIPDCDGRGNQNENKSWVPMMIYVDPKLQSEYENLKNQGDTSAFTTVFKNNQLRLLIEPLHWSYVPVINPTDPRPDHRGTLFQSSWCTSEMIYGPISKVLYWVMDQYQKKFEGVEGYDMPVGMSWSQFVDWARIHGMGVDWDWDMADEAYMLASDQLDLGLYQYDNSSQDTLWHKLNYHNNLGYGVMVTSLTEQEGTSTFDEQTYGTDYSEGPSEDKSKEGGNEAQNNIVKFYAKKTGNDYTYKSNYTREKTVGTIVIEDELIGGYTVDNWFTSPTYKKPVAQTDSYDDTKNSIENKQSGTDTGTVTLNQGETLYVRLIESPKVVKIYTTGGNTDKVETDPNPEFSDGKLIIKTPDDGYDYEENTQSPEDKDVTSWEEVPDGKTTTDTTVPVEDDTTVIYIHYNKDPEDTGSKLLLHENEISHQFNLSDANGGSLVDGIRKYSSVSSSARCNAVVGNTGYPDYNDIHCRSRYTYDYSDDWSFTITNDADYASNKTFTWAWVQTDQKDYSGNGLSESGGTGTSTPNGEIILQRTINDTVTLYPGKNGGNESKLQEMGLRAPSYTPAKARKDGATDQPTRKTWYETFTTNWQFHNANTPTAYFSPSCGHGGTDTDSHTNTGNEAEVNATYSKANNTEIYGLWGRANAGLSSPDETSNLKNAKWVFNKLNFIPRKEHLKTSEIQFYPYYKMKFVSEINGAEQDAYLTSENLSKLLNVQRVDTSISANGGNKSTGNSLYLDSTQWSIHTKAQTLLDNNNVQDSRSLLPSGAIYTLSDGELSGNKAPNKYIGVHLYSTYVSDKSKLANTGDILNESEANAQIDAFKEEVKRVLEGYEIQMFGALGIIADENEFQKEAVKITGTAGETGKYAIGTSQFDRDTSKYDLKTVENYTSHTAEANRADIDIKHIDEVTYDWKLTSDADGNIRIYRDGQELASLTKTQGVASITNKDVQEFDARTKLVTNYVAALDRNMGSDRTGNKWYNEGWDELHCKELRISYTMGFARDNNGTAGQRSAALNIKANGVLDSRTDMFNGAEEKNRTWRFLTSEKSLAAQKKNVGYIGTFNGIEVFVPGMQSLFTSKLFYTSNTSVMDLN